MRSFKLLLLSLFLIALVYPQGGITQPSTGFANPMTGADQLIGSAGSSSGTPSAVSLLNCATALTYSTGTHTFGCNAAAAGVSSVSGDGTIITNSLSTGAVTLTIAGVSGGVPYFSSTSTWASSALLPTGDFVLGGGAGGAPTASFATVPINKGGTNAITAAAALINLFPTASEVGDLVYCATFSAGCTSWALLPGNTSGTKYLQETAAGVPSWTTPAGGVTSVSGDGTIITNRLSTGAVTLTIAGVSGGVPYFSSTSAWASSALLTANVLMKGGGAGAAPSNSSITDNGTTITTVESILISGASSQFGLNQSGGAMLTMPANTSIYSFGPNSRIVSGSIAASGFFTSARWDGTVGSPTAVQSGDQLGGYNSFAYNGTTIAGPYGTFRCFAAENQTTIAGGTYCEIGTTTNGTTTEVGRIRVENDGGITIPSTVTGGDKGIGTLNAAGLYVNGVAVSTATTLPLSSITAATTTNTIANGNNAQVWNWALTGSTVGMTFGETTAATGAGNVLLNVVMKSGSTAIAHQITFPGLGTTYADALYAVNTTPATNGAQQVCPNIDIGGQGYGTTGAASQAVNWVINCLPVQGAAAPTATLQFRASINGGAFSNVMSLTSAGVLSVGTGVTTGGFLQAGTSQIIGWSGRLNLYSLNTTTLGFGNQANAAYPALSYTTQTNPILSVLDSNGGSTAQLAIPYIQSTTGQRYVCITTTGILVSSAAACVGT